MTVSAINSAIKMEEECTLRIIPGGSLQDSALFAALARLEKICFSVPWSESAYRFVLSSGYHKLFLLEKEGNIIGWAVLFLIFEEGELQNIAVIPEERGKGHAQKLLTAVLEEARAQGGEVIRLEVREGNIPARKLYEKNGFEEDGRRKNYYKEPTEDAVLMKRQLTVNI